jgi:toxin-antitoxin system PIN domain toxin
MIVPDVNLLLYAYDNSSLFHQEARSWWEGCLSGGEPVGLAQPVLLAFIRVGTSSRVFQHPLTLNEARDCVISWINRGITRVLQPASNHILQVLDLLAAADSAGGNLVTDAEIAAIAIAHRAEVHTADRDFLRFPDLSCRYPLTRK